MNPPSLIGISCGLHESSLITQNQDKKVLELVGEKLVEQGVI
jgi:hypothetical protein